jgi:hypothetical protein
MSTSRASLIGSVTLLASVFVGRSALSQPRPLGQLLPATLTKSFAPTAINDGGVTTLTFTLVNPNASAITATFTDTLPASLRVATPAAVGGTCQNAAAATTANAGGTTIASTLVQVLASSTCVVTVNVTNVPGETNPDCASAPAAFTNSPGNVTGDVTNSVTAQCLVVIGPTPTSTATPAATSTPTAAPSTPTPTSTPSTAPAGPAGIPVLSPQATAILALALAGAAFALLRRT